MIGRLLLTGWASVALFTAPLEGQCVAGLTCTVTIQMPVKTIMALSVSPTSTPLGNPTNADFNAGFKDVAGPTVSARANRSFKVQVDASTPNFNIASKPASELLWGTVSGTYGNNAGTAASLITSGASAGVSQQIFFRTVWNFANSPPGSYTLTVRYTISAP